MKTYEVRDIAAYVIEEYNRRGAPISNFKLQKVLYYIQARYLVDYDIPAFYGVIEKWQLGPVVPEIYYLYKYNKANDIKEPEKICNIGFEEDGSINLEIVEYALIIEDDRLVIDGVITATIPIDKYDLMDMTRKHKPYLDWHENGEHKIFSAYSNNEIWRYFYHSREELL